jgi:preprotein translocase subunit Sec61beta
MAGLPLAAGGGGLMNYKEEYNSKLKIGPVGVLGMLIFTLVLELVLHFFI